jgi:hypothetical protein
MPRFRFGAVETFQIGLAARCGNLQVQSKSSQSKPSQVNPSQSKPRRKSSIHDHCTPFLFGPQPFRRVPARCIRLSERSEIHSKYKQNGRIRFLRWSESHPMGPSAVTYHIPKSWARSALDPEGPALDCRLEQIQVSSPRFTGGFTSFGSLSSRAAQNA